MKDYNIIIKIGTNGLNEDDVLDKNRDILFFIQDNVSMENYEINIEEVGEYMG